jgi:hypothetical protein
MPVLNNERHERFCQGIAAGMNQTQAYIGAGFGATLGRGAAQAAHKLRQKQQIAARIAELGRIRDMSRIVLQERIEREVIAQNVEVIQALAVSQEFVRERLLEIVERSLQHRPVLDTHGRPLIIETANGALAAAYTYDPKPAVAALRLLAQTEGMLVERNPRARKDGDAASEEALNDRLLEKFAEIKAKQAIENARQEESAGTADRSHVASVQMSGPADGGKHD